MNCFWCKEKHAGKNYGNKEIPLCKMCAKVRLSRKIKQYINYVLKARKKWRI